MEQVDINDVYDVLCEVESRLVRVETRLCELMQHEGIVPRCAATVPEEVQ
jgi:hypothetical protein